MFVTRSQVKGVQTLRKTKFCAKLPFAGKHVKGRKVSSATRPPDAIVEAMLSLCARSDHSAESEAFCHFASFPMAIASAHRNLKKDPQQATASKTLYPPRSL